MEELDLDAFIANIEQTAPEEEESSTKLVCRECNVPLEEKEDTFVCPNCSAEATNILQLQESELYLDPNDGQLMVGQRVKQGTKKKGDTIDYGCAWSTDDAIVHILNLQVSALETLGLVPDLFRVGVTNMWTKFWVNHIGPFIKDEYEKGDLVLLRDAKHLKLRDVEVLIRVQDKVLIPQRCSRAPAQRKSYYAAGGRFYKTRPSLPSEGTPDSDGNTDFDGETNSDELANILESAEFQQQDDNLDAPDDLDVWRENRVKTTSLNRDNVVILTLNRTLAFLEATARSMDLTEPLFASDILRLCSQRLIPFYGAHKTIPEEFKLSPSDVMMFKKTALPSPVHLTKMADLLIKRLYHDKLPKLLPVPDLDKILLRFIHDMNLPSDLMNYIGGKITFSCFPQTQGFVSPSSKTALPQFDRWAFAILVVQMKMLFHLGDKSVQEQSDLVERKSDAGGSFFNFLHWAQQMSGRLRLIMSYDPYILVHPMNRLELVEPTPQTYKLLDVISSDKATSSFRIRTCELHHDDDFRKELNVFLERHLPKSPRLRAEEADELEKPEDLRYPLRDAFNRTKKYWLPVMMAEGETLDTLLKDFSGDKVITLEKVPQWFICAPENSSLKGLEPSSDWPFCFNLLLSVGGYLCYCKPQALLHEICRVEEYASPSLRLLRQQKSRLKRLKT